jgi:hypothetical protein
MITSAYPQKSESPRRGPLGLAGKLVIASGLASAGFLGLLLLSLLVAPARGLSGRYFANFTFSGTPATVRRDARILFDKEDLIKRVGGSDRLSVIWEGFAYAPKDAAYTVSTRSDDGSQFFIDGVLVVDNGGIRAAQTKTDEIPLTRGNHKVLVRFFDIGGAGFIDVPASKFRFYPNPVTAGLYRWDAVLSGLTLGFMAGLGCSLLLFIVALVGTVWPLWRTSVLSPNRWRAGVGRIYAGARRNVRLLAIVVFGVGLAVLAAEKGTPVHGLTGTYFDNAAWAGKPVATRLDVRTRFWKEDVVEVTKAGDHSSVIWEGFIFAPRDAYYRFYSSSDDGSWIFVDDTLVVDNGGRHPPLLAQRTVLLKRGSHKLTVKYFDAGGGGQIAFDWTRAAAVPLPGWRLGFYPRPVGAGVVRLDTVLFYLKILFKAAWLVAALLLLWLALRTIGPMFDRAVAFEAAALSRADRFLDKARTKIRLIVILAGVLVVVLVVVALVRPAHGLAGAFYPNKTWTGVPTTTSLDNVISFKKDTLSARSGEEDILSAVWSGYLYIPKNSDYQFTLGSDDGGQVFLDDRLVLDNGGEHPLQVKDRTVTLARGNYKLLIKYFDAGNKGAIDFRVHEMTTPRWLKPKVFLYPKPTGLAAYAFDVACPYLVTPVRAALAILVVLLLFLIPKVIRPKRTLVSVLALTLFLGLGGVFGVDLIRNRSTAVIGCDSYAYLNGAELMARNGFFRTEYRDPLVPRIHERYQPAPPVDKEMFLFSPHGHYVYDLNAGLIYNVFPPGTSMLLYPFVKWGGRDAAFFVLPVMTLLLVLAFFLLGAKAVDPVFGLFVAALTFMNVQVFENSVLIMSDIPSLALVAASAYCLTLQLKKPRRIYPFLAGACFGFAFVVRYSNLAGALPLVYLMGLGFWKDRRWKEWTKNVAAFGVSAFLFGVLPLGLYTHRLFGSFLRLVYEPTTQSQTSLAYLKEGVPFYLKNLTQTFGLPALVLGVLGLVGCLARPRHRPVGIVCVLGLFSFFAFYALQSIRQERYLMPGYPFLAVLFAFGVFEIRRLVRRSPILAFLVVLVCAAYPLLRSQALFPEGIRDGEEIASALGRKVSARAVVFCDEMSGPLRMYAGLPGYRFLWTDPGTLGQTVRILWTMDYDIYFYLDSAIAEFNFPSMVGPDAEREKRVTRVGMIRGRPLVRLERPAGPETRTSPNN